MYVLYLSALVKILSKSSSGKFARVFSDTKKCIQPCAQLLCSSCETDEVQLPVPLNIHTYMPHT